MFYLVCFDIVDNRMRRQTVKVIENYGCRVQKSVFECPGLTEEQFIKMKTRIEDCIDHTEDNVRYYHICRGCVRRIENSGVTLITDQEAFRVV